MNREALKKIFENYSEIIGIRINGIYYHVNCFDTDTLCNYDFEELLDDEYALDEYIAYTYQLDENNFYLEYDFTAQDILNAKNVKLYKLQEI